MAPAPTVAQIRKLLVAAAGYAAALLAYGLVPAPYDKYVSGALAFLASIGVYAVPNAQPLEEPVKYDPAANVTQTWAPPSNIQPIRNPGKYGRNEKKNDPRTLQLGKYLTTVPLPPSVDWTTKLTQPWGMLGNDNEGDCTIAAKCHIYMAQAINASGARLIFTTAQALKAYSALMVATGYPPNADEGASMLDALNFARNTGIDGHKVGAFAEIQPTNHDHIKYAVYVFGAVDIGLNLPQSAEDQFSAGQTWDVVKGSPIAGGHDVPIVGYNETGPLCVTWGQVQQMTWAFLDKYCDEAYAVLDPDWLSSDKSPGGFDLATLTADLAAIKGGGDLPPIVVPPAPTPSPSPDPAADTVLAALDPATLARLTANADRRKQAVEDDAARIIAAYFK